MRYEHTGNVHKDFHLATETTIAYVLEHCGRPFLEELFERTAQRVYRDIHQSLVSGDYEPLLEHWRYYYEREDGEYRVEHTDGGVDFIVLDCPAVRHVIERHGSVDERFYLQFELLCAGFSERTPFDISFTKHAPTSYTYHIRHSDEA